VIHYDEKDGEVVTAGSRVLGGIARSKDIAPAIEHVYQAVKKIR
jgi:phosphoribosylamine-glycine ligase